MSRFIWSILTTALVLAAGCGGGSDDEESASEEWVSGFCSAAADWSAALQEIETGAPASPSVESLRTAMEDGLDATEALADDLRALGRPDTEAGQEAAEQVDAMTSEIELSVEEVRAEFSEDASVTEILNSFTQAMSRIAQAGTAFDDSIDELGNLDGAEELRDEIDENEDCDAAEAAGG